MSKLFLILAAALLPSSAVTRAATLTYEATGLLSYVSSGSHNWTIGTPFAVRFSYAAESLQIAQVFQDFPAPLVLAAGDFLLDSQLVVSFADQLIWHSDDPNGLGFSLDLGVRAYDEIGISVGLPTATPDESELSMFAALTGGFLPDGKLFDDSAASRVSVIGRVTFGQAGSPSAIGWGDIDSIRIVPEPGILLLGAIGLIALGLFRCRIVPRTK